MYSESCKPPKGEQITRTSKRRGTPQMGPYFVGIDVGSSSVKTSIFDAEKGISLGQSSYPSTEQVIESLFPGWAEQDPAMWWDHFTTGYAQIVSEHSIDTQLIGGIGIAYQMHGLVVVDKEHAVLRKSIIWCDSRAVNIGAKAFTSIGEEKCLSTLLNSPGNFTASKLRWLQKNEPIIYGKVFKFMLPGDFIAMKLSGEITTTPGGLSEGVFWNFKERSISEDLVRYYEIDRSHFPDLVPSIGEQVTVSADVADELGLKKDTKVTYRAGDQPNNAFSLGVLDPGQVAATAGTSGVIYAVSDADVYDEKSRINTFLHVNDTPEQKRNGVLVCLNGTGILYSWLKRLLSDDSASISYEEMNRLATQVATGSDGLQFYPFGNGAERILENRQINANILNLDFNHHRRAHLIRAGMEGIVFALNLGFEILKSYNVPFNTISAGNSNLFLSKTFREIFANTTESVVQIYDTDGAEGAARGAALGAGFYSNYEEAFHSLTIVDLIEPQNLLVEKYAGIFDSWKKNMVKL